MADTPNRAMPVIDDQMIIRWRLGGLLAFISSLVGGAVFCTALWIKVDRLGDEFAEMKAWMRGQNFTIRGMP